MPLRTTTLRRNPRSPAPSPRLGHELARRCVLPLEVPRFAGCDHEEVERFSYEAISQEMKGVNLNEDVSADDIEGVANETDLSD